MTTFIGEIIASADYFILLMFRVGGLVVSSPIFGRVNIPTMVKIIFTAAISYLFFIIFPQNTAITYSTLIGFVLLCASELLLGLALAFVTNMFFALVSYTAGQVIDMQIGFGIVNVYDAQNNTQAPVMGNIINLMLLIMFFAIDGHLMLIEMVYLTINRMPIGTLVLSPEIGLVMLEIFKRAFMIGLMMALPILGSGLTLEIAFGLMMRAVPQLHMFVIGVPLKMLVGMIVYAATLPVYVGFSSRIFEEIFNAIERVFALFVGA